MDGESTQQLLFAGTAWLSGWPCIGQSECFGGGGGHMHVPFWAGPFRHRK